MWIVNITLAIIMLGVALDIKISDFKNLFKNPKTLIIGVSLQFLIVPLTTLILVYILKPQASLALGLMMVAACPGGNVSNFMTKLAKGNTALSVSLTAFATAMALFMTPINLAIWANLYQPTAEILRKINLNPFKVAEIVILILGIPLLIGMAIKHFKPLLAQKLSRILRPVSILILLAFIIGAFYDNIKIFLKHIHHAFYLVLILNALLYIIGFYTAKFFKLSYKDQKTLSIETGIQNSGLGLMLIFLFFNELGGMALLVAFWSVWDIFSGLVLAYFWSKKK
jgi:BASS family bile acid:Na+ symporter